MIRITKDLNIVPTSLIPAIPGLFPGRKTIPVTARTTHTRRMEVIVKKGYIDETSYNDRYKLADIKAILEKIYHGKCAFCEQKVEQKHVEHYRPKKTYYWLAFSW